MLISAETFVPGPVLHYTAGRQYITRPDVGTVHGRTSVHYTDGRQYITRTDVSTLHGRQYITQTDVSTLHGRPILYVLFYFIGPIARSSINIVLNGN